MAAGRVWTRNPRVSDPTGAGTGAVFAPRVCGFGDPKRVGSGAGFNSPPRGACRDPELQEARKKPRKPLAN